MTAVRLSVYVPKHLHTQAKLLGINVSALMQDALRDEINARKEELDRLVQLGTSSQNTLDALSEVIPEDA